MDRPRKQDKAIIGRDADGQPAEPKKALDDEEAGSFFDFEVEFVSEDDED